MASKNSFPWAPMDLAWAAGLLEGEGSFMPGLRDKRRKDGRTVCRLLISCSSTDRDVLERLQNIFGGTIILQYRKGQQRNVGRYTKDCWRWSFQKAGHKVYAIMVALYKFMGERRKKKILECLGLFRQFGPAYYTKWNEVCRG